MGFPSLYFITAGKAALAALLRLKYQLLALIKSFSNINFKLNFIIITRYIGL